MEPSIRLFITSRLHVDLEPEFGNLSRNDITASNSAVKAYLTSEINENSKLARLTTKDPQLKEDIINGISEKAGGM